MSKFSSYAVRASEVARDALTQLAAAEAALNDAENDVRRTRLPRGGAVSIEKQQAAINAEYNRFQAQEHRELARKAVEDARAQLAQIRRELSAALNDECGVDPSMIDANAVSLLSSGILTAREFYQLARKAKNDGNVVMARLVAHHAGVAAEKLEAWLGPGNGDVQALRAIELDGADAGANDAACKLNSFDAIMETFDTCVNNGGMSDAWDGLVGPIIENF